MTEQPKPEKFILALAKTEKWFSDTHDRLYAEHEKLAKKHDWYCKFLESAMGAHDSAWVRWEYFLADLEIPFDTILKWREPTITKVEKTS